MTDPDPHVPPGPDLPWRDEPGRDGACRDEAGRRAVYRAWVRQHHPDRGGDPSTFAQGLQAWQHALRRPTAGNSGTARAGSVTFHRTRRSSPLTWWQVWRAERARPARVR